MYIRAKVTAHARKESLEELSSGTFKIVVRDPTKHNLANKRVIQLLAVHFRVVEAHIRIISGHHSPNKLLSIKDS